jgi:hypothetical protein
MLTLQLAVSSVGIPVYTMLALNPIINPGSVTCSKQSARLLACASPLDFSPTPCLAERLCLIAEYYTEHPGNYSLSRASMPCLSSRLTYSLVHCTTYLLVHILSYWYF